MARSKIKPLLWLLFSSGGTVIALVLPIIILLFAILQPLGFLSVDLFQYETLHAFFHHWLVKIITFGIFTLLFWHAGHRFYLTLQDLSIGKGGLLTVIICYGSAMLGTLLTLWALCLL